MIAQALFSMAAIVTPGTFGKGIDTGLVLPILTAAQYIVPIAVAISGINKLMDHKESAGTFFIEMVTKGGSIEDTAGRMCICNGLMATAGMGQLRAHHRREPAVVTAGDSIGAILKLRELYGDYSAADVIAYLAQRGGRAAAG